MGTTSKIKKSLNSLYMSNKKYRIKRDIKKFILDDDHPCVMAQTLMKQKHIEFDLYSKMVSSITAQKLLLNIENYIENYNFDSDVYKTYMAVFPDDHFDTEDAFEQGMWELLKFVNLYDDKLWDPTVSDNPSDNNFSFSIKGKAFYIVGMHPNSSRNARRTQYPMLVFNLHWQFEQLRKHGVYQTVKNQIRERDLEKNGSINPVLKDFGTASEALQYSGKNNSDQWECPFKNK